MENLKRFLECSICLEQYEKPKLLNCGHHFCKECIEDMLTFRRDGSGLIVCPMRCESTTTIKKIETVSDLVTSYDFKNIIETLQKADDRPQSAQRQCHYNDCFNEVCIYCCKSLMCKTCFQKHKESEGHGQNLDRAVAFSHRENKFLFICQTHRCGCTHVCADGALLCKYCLHRNGEHSGHEKKTIDNEVTRIKEALQGDKEKIELLAKFGAKTKENISLLQAKLSELLELRKREVRLFNESIEENQAVDLDEEVLKLNEQLKLICKRHVQFYSMDFPMRIYQSFLEGNELEIVLKKQNILNTLSRGNVRTHLKKEFVCLTSATCSSPLGTFSVSSCEEIDLAKRPEPFSTLVSDGNESQLIACTKKRIKDMMRARRKNRSQHVTADDAHPLDTVAALPPPLRKKKGFDRRKVSSELAFARNNPKLVEMSLTMSDFIEGAWFKKGNKEGTKGTLNMCDGVNSKFDLAHYECVLFYGHPTSHLGRRCSRCDHTIASTVDLYRFTIGDTPGREFLCYFNRACGHFLPLNDCLDTICWHYSLYFQKKTWIQFFRVFMPVMFHCVKSIVRIILVNMLDLVCRFLDPLNFMCFSTGFIIYLYVLEYFKFPDIFNKVTRNWFPDLFETGDCGCRRPIHLPIDIGDDRL